ncbi:hypothetical protein TCAL_15659, partial [Tigriopus californicus]
MDFCQDPFYNSSLTWNTTTPDLTQCMQDTLLTGLPCLFFLLTEPFWIIYKIYYYSIQSFPISRDSRNKWGWLFLIKVVLNLVLILNLILQIWNQSHDEFYGSEVFRFMAMMGTIVLMLVAMVVEKWNKIHTSPPMFLFWGLLLLVKIPTVKDHVHHLTNDPTDAMYWALALTYYPVFLIQIICHCWADHSNMDDVAQKPPESVASFPATIFYTWIDPLIWTGLKAPLTLDQVPPQPQYVTVSYVIQDFLNQWSRKVSKIEKNFIKDRDPAGEKHVKILDVLFATYGKRFFLIFLLGTINFTLIFVGPIMLKLLIQHVQSTEEAWKGFAYVILIFANASLQSLLNHQFLQQTVISAQQIRASLSSMIYRKTLKLSNLARKKFTMGEITNFISTDIQTLGMTIPYMNNVWVAPMKIIIAMFFLYEELKSVAFIGVGIMAVLLPLNYWSSVIIKKMRKNQMEAKDGRIKLMNEVLKGMRVLKLYAWELPFMDRINAIRLTEVKLMKSLAKIYAISNFTLNSGPTLITIACFGLYTVFQPGEVLTADKIFVSIALFNIIRIAILGEMEKTDGHINQSGTLAYVPQQAWIQNMTLKNNILFEKPFHGSRYKRTLEACALKDDLDILISGDETEIGENGINLSGGQKQRVSVARAVYSDSDVYLLDDPLSAVDAHVGRHLFDKVFSSKSGILKDRTRVLVTHNVSFLDQMDLILVMRNGTIAERGSYSQLKESKGAFSEFLEQYANQPVNEEIVEDHEKDKKLQVKPVKARQIPPRARRMSQTLSCSPASPFIKYLSSSVDAPLPDDILAEEEEEPLIEATDDSTS